MMTWREIDHPYPNHKRRKKTRPKSQNPRLDIDDQDYKQKFPRIGIGGSNKITFSSKPIQLDKGLSHKRVKGRTKRPKIRQQGIRRSPRHRRQNMVKAQNFEWRKTVESFDNRRISSTLISSHCTRNTKYFEPNKDLDKIYNGGEYNDNPSLR